MWLDKFVFCGQSVGPTSVYLSAAERLANGGRFPLGRYLLGSVYHLLHQVAKKLLLGHPIGNLGGPWWFINMWLSVHMHKRLEFNLFAQRFPRDIAEDHQLDEEESATRSPLNYGEAAIVLPGTGGNEDQVSRFFQTLYEGLAKEQRAWMPYEDPDTRFPLTFHPLDNALNKDHDLMMAIITPRAIPVNFFGSGKASNLTYEFYNPSALAHQLAFGQLLIALCYTDVVKPRQVITSGLEWIRIAQLPPNADTSDIDLSTWILALFITQAYKQWWAEWKEQLFYRSALTYRGMIDSTYKVPENTVSLQPMPQSYYFCCYQQLTSSVLYRSIYSTVGQQKRQADRTPPIGPDLFDRQQCTKLSGSNAPGCAFQENHHQAGQDVSIGRCCCFGACFQGRKFLSLQFIPIPFYTYTAFSGYISCHGDFIDHFHCLNQNSINTRLHLYL